MPLKGNPNSKGPLGGKDQFSGPLGLYSKKHTWEYIWRHLNAKNGQGEPIFSKEERQAVIDKNKGLNARQLSSILKSVKRRYKART